MINSFLISLATAMTLLGYTPEDLNCLTEAIYFEARGEPLSGQLAVGNVIMNRVESDNFPNTICGVVHQGKQINGRMVRHKCQFSYYCDGKKEEYDDREAYIISSKVAMDVIFEPSYEMYDALYYHSVTVEPFWSHTKEYLGSIGNHEFYK